MQNVIKLQLTSRKALEIIRDIANNATHCVVPTAHATKRMKERKIFRRDLLQCLRHGKIIEGPARAANGNWEFKMCSLEAGERINIAAALDYDRRGNYIIIITTYR